MIQKEDELLRRGEVEKEKETDTCDSKEKENGGKRARARKRTMKDAMDQNAAMKLTTLIH